MKELYDNVIDSHIDLYVNDFIISLGEKGSQAVIALMEMAKACDLV